MTLTEAGPGAFELGSVPRRELQHWPREPTVFSSQPMALSEQFTGLVCATVEGDPHLWQATRHPGISWRPLHVDPDSRAGDATVLIRMEPGSSYPEHEHLGVEEVLILAGGYRDADGEHRAGSYLRYPEGSRHAPVALGDPRANIGVGNPACVLFAVAHGGVRLTTTESI